MAIVSEADFFFEADENHDLECIEEIMIFRFICFIMCESEIFLVQSMQYQQLILSLLLLLVRLKIFSIIPQMNCKVCWYD